MKIIVGGRGFGKTTKLIELSEKTGAYIVCSNPHEVAEMALKMKKEIPFPLRYSEFRRGEYRRKLKPPSFLIDNIDMFFNTVGWGYVEAISLTPTEVTHVSPVGNWSESKDE